MDKFSNVRIDYIPTLKHCDELLSKFLHQNKRNCVKCTNRNPRLITTCPFVKKVSPKNAIKLIDAIDNSQIKCMHNTQLKENYCHEDRLEEYFISKPTCYIILGQPDVTHYNLGKDLSVKLKCPHIDATNLVRNELETNTDLGIWIRENLPLNRKIPICIVLHLLANALNTNEVKEHGYILTGFPIIPAGALTDDTLPLSWRKIPLIAAAMSTASQEFSTGVNSQQQWKHVSSFQNEFHEDNSDILFGNLRRVPVPDDRFTYLCEYFKPLSKVPAFLNVVDIAGLVKGAAEGQGLGNAFLSHISACDAIFHLLRAFEETEVIHVEGEVDPVRDLEIISEELRLKDEEKLLQNLEKLERTVLRGGDKKLKPEYDTLVKIKGVLVDEKKHIRFADWSAHDIEVLNKYLFLTSKPVIYLINLSEKDFFKKKNKWLVKIKEWIDKNDSGASIIPFSGVFESKLVEMDDTERKMYEEEHKCKSMLDKIIVTGYKALHLEYFFTAGADEVKAWTVQKGTKAPQAAGRIHTDFEKGFIMAEVMHYKDFKEEGSEAAARSAGKYRQQGRNYVVEDGDIIFFKFNAGAGLKDAKKK